MTKKIIYSEKAPKAIGPYSQAVQIENFLFLSGQIGLNPKTNKLENKNLQSELEQIMENITSILNEANMKIENIIKTSVFMKDLSSFSDFNNIYKSFFKEKFPARETIEVSKLPMDARIEISIIAYKK
ncbi:MAG: reactive intermediate/imine deaminase [Flavobacteriales bacterium]|nr:reactive intermediate/imine deaminase [Flavobacteriales bacterium]